MKHELRSKVPSIPHVALVYQTHVAMKQKYSYQSVYKYGCTSLPNSCSNETARCVVILSITAVALVYQTHVAMKPKPL